jgi:predicted deacylase
MTGSPKRVWHLDIPGGDGEPDTYVPVGVIEGLTTGPSAAVVAGVHGTEWVGQDAVQALWRELSPESIHGSLTVIFAADVVAAAAGSPGVTPFDRRNLNRVWPGAADGTWSERLAARLWDQLLGGPEVVIDIHGGEWTEEVNAFGLVHPTGADALDQHILQLAQRMGLPFIAMTEGVGTLSGAVARDGRVGLAMEVGGGGRRTREDVGIIVRAIRGALAAAGSLAEGEPGSGGPAIVLDKGEMVRSPADGVLVPAVEVGQRVTQGETLATIHGFDGTLLHTVASPAAGMVLLRSVARVVAPGSLLVSLGWADQ